jgi:hypothetical protein
VPDRLSCLGCCAVRASRSTGGAHYSRTTAGRNRRSGVRAGIMARACRSLDMPGHMPEPHGGRSAAAVAKTG